MPNPNIITLTIRVQLDAEHAREHSEESGLTDVRLMLQSEIRSHIESLPFVQDVHVGESSAMFTVHISPNSTNNPPGKLADAELHFTEGTLEGLKLIGFGIWERRGGGRNVTFPARQYSVNGERRSFALLRPVADAVGQDRIRDLILEAYADYEEKEATRDALRA